MTNFILFFIIFLIALTFLKHLSQTISFKTFLNGLKDGLRGGGFALPKSHRKSEKYIWVCMLDENVCEDCLERSRLPAMDIADWMNQGLPRTPEANTSCETNCRCQLELINPSSEKLLHA